MRGTLLRLDEAQARYAELAAATGDPAWAARHGEAAGEATRQRADAARLAPEEALAADLSSAAEAVAAREHRAFSLVRDGRAEDAWQLLQGDDHQWARERYAAAVGRFGDQVDAAADAELRQVQAETLWSLASATAVAGLIGVTAAAGWLVGLGRGRGRTGYELRDGRTAKA
jgi:hypothetical protein